MGGFIHSTIIIFVSVISSPEWIYACPQENELALIITRWACALINGFIYFCKNFFTKNYIPLCNIFSVKGLEFSG